MTHSQTQGISPLGFLTLGLAARETASKVINPLGQALFISFHTFYFIQMDKNRPLFCLGKTQGLSGQNPWVLPVTRSNQVYL